MPSNRSIPDSREIKCKICDVWYDYDPSQLERNQCPQCSIPARERIKQDPPLPEEENPFSLDLNKSLLPIKPDDHWIVFGFKKLVNFLFLIYLFFMAALSWMAVTFSG